MATAQSVRRVLLLIGIAALLLLGQQLVRYRHFPDVEVIRRVAHDYGPIAHNRGNPARQTLRILNDSPDLWVVSGAIPSCLVSLQHELRIPPGESADVALELPTATRGPQVVRGQLRLAAPTDAAIEVTLSYFVRGTLQPTPQACLLEPDTDSGAFSTVVTIGSVAMLHRPQVVVERVVGLEGVNVELVDADDASEPGVDEVVSTGALLISGSLPAGLSETRFWIHLIDVAVQDGQRLTIPVTVRRPVCRIVLPQLVLWDRELPNEGRLPMRLHPAWQNRIRELSFELVPPDCGSIEIQEDCVALTMRDSRSCSELVVRSGTNVLQIVPIAPIGLVESGSGR